MTWYRDPVIMWWVIFIIGLAAPFLSVRIFYKVRVWFRNRKGTQSCFFIYPHTKLSSSVETPVYQFEPPASAMAQHYIKQCLQDLNVNKPRETK